MSKPISFGFGKPKAPTNGPAKPPTSISIPSKKPATVAKPLGLKSRSALHADDDDGIDEDEPKHESVTGFSSTGAILSKPVEEKKVVVIENQGNGDWRRRGRGGKNVLPEEERARRDGQDVVMIEKNEVSTASGLQFASASKEDDPVVKQSQQYLASTNGHQETKPKTVDEEALQALLSDDPNAPRGTAVISISENKQLRPADELEDFRSDVASRPEVPSLDEYAAMPVEEFGLAMLRGMGKKRRANGEVINVEPEPEKKQDVIKKPKHEGFLGIGAKPAPGIEGVELGAWGKADMRKNNKGQGFFTPVMIRDRETGETITEEELERRKQARNGKDESEDWRTRKERDTEKDSSARKGNGEYKDAMNGFSRRRKDEDSGHESSISRRDRDRDSDYDKSRSKRTRSRSRERRHRDDERYDSGSLRRDKDRDHGRDRDRDRDRHRDRHKERDRDHDRDDKRYRDRR